MITVAGCNPASTKVPGSRLLHDIYLVPCIFSAPETGLLLVVRLRGNVIILVGVKIMQQVMRDAH